MKNELLVVIGANAAGMSAASKLRRLDTKKKILVFEKGKHPSFSACGIPYLIGGEVKSAKNLIARTPEEFLLNQNIEVKIQHEVLEIDVSKKRILVLSLVDKTEFWQKYDDLLIATGTSPISPKLPGIEAKGVFAFSSLESGKSADQYIKKHQPKIAVIIGGGYIGIEMAEALLHLGIKVSLIDMAPQVMATLDPDMSEIIAAYMKKEGVHLFLGQKLESLEMDDSGTVSVVVTDKKRIKADLVILGIGVRPNSKIAEAAGLKIGAGGAIQVNKKLETSAEHVWAAGDCAESYHLVSGKEIFISLGTVANKHGQIAGININGGKAEFPGVVGTAITKFKDLEISRTGLSEKKANQEGIDYQVAIIESSVFSVYLPESEKITVKLLSEKASGRLLGGQIVGGRGAGKRIDVIAIALQAKMTARDLVFADLAYVPPLLGVWDPVQIAARQLVR